MDDLREKTLSKHTIYKGNSFSFCSDEVEFPNGNIGKRDYVQYPEAAVIIPFLDEDTILLIEQFRYSISQSILELPAGKIDDPTEPGINAASRELREETGYTSDNITYLLTYYPAVGYSTEVIHVYTARDLTQSVQELDEDEFINIRPIKLDKALDMVKTGEIKDAKTILALLYVAQFKNNAPGKK